MTEALPRREPPMRSRSSVTVLLPSLGRSHATSDQPLLVESHAALDDDKEVAQQGVTITNRISPNVGDPLICSHEGSQSKMKHSRSRSSNTRLSSETSLISFLRIRFITSLFRKHFQSWAGTHFVSLIRPQLDPCIYVSKAQFAQSKGFASFKKRVSQQTIYV